MQFFLLRFGGFVELCTIFANVVPFPGLKTLLATIMHEFIPQNDLPCCRHNDDIFILLYIHYVMMIFYM